MGSNTGKNKDADLAATVAAGITKHLSGAGALVFGMGSITPAQLVIQLQTLETLRQAVIAAQAVVAAKLADEGTQAPAIRATLVAFVAYLRVVYANAPDVLSDFGVKPRKPSTPLTTAQRAAANAKREATLKARGIVGTQKRKEVTGNVSGVVVTPIVNAPAALVATAQTAPLAGSPTASATPRTTA
jgi:hypothetical protein